MNKNQYIVRASAGIFVNTESNFKRIEFERIINLDFKPYEKLQMLFEQNDESIELLADSILYDVNKEIFVIFSNVSFSGFHIQRVYIDNEDRWKQLCEGVNEKCLGSLFREPYFISDKTIICNGTRLNYYSIAHYESKKIKLLNFIEKMEKLGFAVIHNDFK